MCLFNRISKDIMDNRQVKISWIIDMMYKDLRVAAMLMEDTSEWRQLVASD